MTAAAIHSHAMPRRVVCAPPLPIPNPVSGELCHERFRFHLVPQADGAQEGIGPVHHGRCGALDEGAGPHRADHAEPADAAAVARHGAQRDDAVAARGVREDPRMPVRDLRAGRGPLPRVMLLPAQLRRHGAAPDRIEDPDHRRAEPAAGHQAAGDDQARHHHLRRRHRHRQIDLAGCDDRLPQRRTRPATSSPSRTRSNTCTSTRAASSRSASWASIPTAGTTR